MRGKIIEKIMFVWLVAFIISLFFSKYILSISMFLLILTAVVVNFRTLGITFKKFINSPNFSGYLVYVFVILLSLLLGGVSDYGLARIRIVIPFIILPFAFYTLPKISKTYYMYLWVFFLGVLAFTELRIVFQYYSDQPFYLSELKRGHVLPTPVHHIRYSLIVGAGVLGSLWWAITEKKRFFLIFAILNFGFLHFLAVKTGLLSLYISIFALIIHFVLTHKKIMWGIILTVGLISLPVIAYYFIPSLQAKINYSKWDYKQFKHGKTKGFSDSQRIISYKVGYEIIKENLLFGTGLGPFEEKINEKYDQTFPDAPQKMKPHNQFIFMWASTGIFGLILSVIGWLSAILFNRKFRDPFLISFTALMFVSFLVENTLGTAVGVAIFLFFNLLHLNYLKEK